MSVSSATGLSSGISLRSIFPNATFLKTDDLTVKSCAGALDECRRSDLFVALVQPDHDGHEDAIRAVQKGATAVLTERLLPISIPQCIVSDSRVAYAKICQALAGDPSARINTIGVAGTDGKTTTCHLIANILVEAGRSTGFHSTLNGYSGTRTTRNRHVMTPPQVAEMMAKMVLAGNSFGVIEANSVQLAQHHYCGMNLDVAVLTNLRGNHFGYHSNLANYRRAQTRLLDYLKPGGVAVLNADDPGTHFILERFVDPVLTVGIRQTADISAKVIHHDLHETAFTLSAGGDTAMIRTRIPGVHHVYNCLAAAATAFLQGIDLPTIARGIEKVAFLPGRMNFVKCGQGFTVAIDESASPYRLGVALNLLQKNTSGKVFCVFNAPEEQGVQVASQFGRIAERNCSVPVISRALANSNQRVGERLDYEPIHQVLDGFSRPSRARVMPNRIAAIEWALSQAKTGDAVLIAGRGDLSIASLSDDRWQLTDGEVCQSWFYGDSVPGQKIPVRAESPSVIKIDDYRQC